MKQGLLLFGLVFAAFSSALPNAWIWDDDDYVTENPVLVAEDGLRKIWTEPASLPQWYPLVHTTFWVERRLWGDDVDGGPNALGYHLDNVLLHAAGAVLLWLLLLRLGFAGAWFLAAAVFLHPVNVESVAWVTERKNVLSLLFSLGSALVFLSWAENRKIKALLGSVLLFVAALFCKTVVASLPAVLFLLLWFRRRPLPTAVWAPLLAMLALGGWMGWQTAVAEVAHVGAEGAAWDTGIADRCLIAGRALWFYAGKAALPLGLNFIYPRWEIDPADWLAWLAPLAALAWLAATFFGRHRFGRGPLVASLIFGGVLFPALGFLNVFPHRFSYVADHFQHHALPAVVILLGSVIFRFTSRGVCAALLLLLGASSFARGFAYKDEETLWKNVLQGNPQASIAHNNLGLIAHDRGDSEEALAKFRDAVAVGDDNVEAMNNLGQSLLQLGLLEEARPLFEKGIAIQFNYVKLHVNLADYWRIRAAQEKKPSFARSAIEEYELANRLNPDGPIPQASLFAGRLHASLGFPKEALRNFEQARRHRDFRTAAEVSILWILSTHPQPNIRDANRAMALALKIQATPVAADPRVLDAMAAAYANAGKFKEAADLARQAIFRAMEQNQDSLSGQIRKRLGLYSSGLPLRTQAGLPK